MVILMFAVDKKGDTLSIVCCGTKRIILMFDVDKKGMSEMTSHTASQ